MTAPEDQNGLREALAQEVWHARYGRREPEEVADRLIAGPLAPYLAAEAEITRLKEGMEAQKRFHLESLREAHRGFVMIHDGLAESTQPKQACGEVCAHWRDRFAAEIERHVTLATLSPKEQP